MPSGREHEFCEKNNVVSGSGAGRGSAKAYSACPGRANQCGMANCGGRVYLRIGYRISRSIQGGGKHPADIGDIIHMLRYSGSHRGPQGRPFNFSFICQELSLKKKKRSCGRDNLGIHETYGKFSADHTVRSRSSYFMFFSGSIGKVLSPRCYSGRYFHFDRERDSRVWTNEHRGN